MLLFVLAACVSEPASVDACVAPPEVEVGRRLVDLGGVGPEEVVTSELWLTSRELEPVVVRSRLWFGSTWATEEGPVGFVVEEEVSLAPGEPYPLVVELSPDWEGHLWDVLSLEASTGTWDDASSTTSVLVQGRGLDTGLPDRPAPAWLGPPRVEPDVVQPGGEVLVDFCVYDPDAEVRTVDLYLGGERVGSTEPASLAGGVRCWEWPWSAPEEGTWAATVEATWYGHQLVDSTELRVLSDAGCLRTPGS